MALAFGGKDEGRGRHLVTVDSGVLQPFRRSHRDLQSALTDRDLLQVQSGRFNIEEAHIADIERIEGLFAIVTIAFLLACLVGSVWTDSSA